MTTASGNLVIVGLNTDEPKYYWKGKQLIGVTKMYLTKGHLITFKVLDIKEIPADMILEGIKIRETL